MVATFPKMPRNATLGLLALLSFFLAVVTEVVEARKTNGAEDKEYLFWRGNPPRREPFRSAASSFSSDGAALFSSDQEDFSLAAYVTVVLVTFSVVFFLASNLLAGLQLRKGGNGNGDSKDKGDADADLKAASIVSSMEELHNIFQLEGDDKEGAFSQDGKTSNDTETTAIDREKEEEKDGGGGGEEDELVAIHGLLQQVLQKKVSISTLGKEDRERLVEALMEQRRRLTGLNPKSTRAPTTEATTPATPAIGTSTEATPPRSDGGSQEDRIPSPKLDSASSSLLPSRPVPWSFTELPNQQEGKNLKKSSSSSSSSSSRERRSLSRSSAIQFPLVGAVGLLLLIFFQTATLLFRSSTETSTAVPAAGATTSAKAEDEAEKTKRRTNLVRAVEEATQNIIRDLMKNRQQQHFDDFSRSETVPTFKPVTTTTTATSTTTAFATAQEILTTTTTTLSSVASTTTTTTKTPEVYKTTAVSKFGKVRTSPKPVTSSETNRPRRFEEEDKVSYQQAIERATTRRPLVELNKSKESKYKLVATSTSSGAVTGERQTGAQKPWVVFSALKLLEDEEKKEEETSLVDLEELFLSSQVEPLRFREKEKVVTVTPIPWFDLRENWIDEEEEELYAGHKDVRRRTRDKEEVRMQLEELRNRDRPTAEGGGGGGDGQKRRRRPELWELLGKKR